MKKVDETRRHEYRLDENCELVVLNEDEGDIVVLSETTDYPSASDLWAETAFEDRDSGVQESLKLVSTSSNVTDFAPAVEPVRSVAGEQPAGGPVTDEPTGTSAAILSVNPTSTDHREAQPTEVSHAVAAAHPPAETFSESADHDKDITPGLAPGDDPDTRVILPETRGKNRRLASAAIFLAALVALLLGVSPHGFQPYLSSMWYELLGRGQLDEASVSDPAYAHTGPALSFPKAQHFGQTGTEDESYGIADSRRASAEEPEEATPPQLATRDSDNSALDGAAADSIANQSVPIVATPANVQDLSHMADMAPSPTRDQRQSATGPETPADAVPDWVGRSPVTEPGEAELQVATEPGQDEHVVMVPSVSMGGSAHLDAEPNTHATSWRSTVAEPAMHEDLGRTEIPQVDSGASAVAETAMQEDQGHTEVPQADSGASEYASALYEIVHPTAVHHQASRQSPIVDILQPGEQAAVFEHVAGTHWYKVRGNLGVIGFVYASAEAQPSAVSADGSLSDLRPRLIALNDVDTGIREIPRMLQQADEYFWSDRLVTPRAKNAWSLYREVLSLDPSNAQAQEGIQRIKVKLFGYSVDAENLGDLETARSLLTKILAVDPNDQRVKARLARLKKTQY